VRGDRDQERASIQIERRTPAAPSKKLVDLNAGWRSAPTPPRGAWRRLRAGFHGQPG